MTVLIEHNPQDGQSVELKWYHHIGDFANLFKAFIGTNYITLAYGVKQSGIGLAIIFYIVIAGLTDHCCQLIVKCKYLMIDDMCCAEMYKRRGTSSTREDSSGESSTRDTENVAALRRRLASSLNYADIGRLTLGKYGAPVISFFVALTQTGFCINYYIFIGNTLLGFFSQSEQPPVGGNTTAAAFTTSPTDAPVTSASNSSEFLPLLQTLVENVTAITPGPNGTVSTNTTNTTTTTSTSLVSTDFSTAVVNFTNFTDVAPGGAVTSGGPPLELLVLAPIPIFIIFTLFRSVRQMSAISFLANLSCLVGYVSVLSYILSDFQVRDDLAWFRWGTLPIFIGQLSASYEAIGTIIPIESSMTGNQHRFPACLHIVVLTFSAMIASLSFVGYLHYGEDTKQILSLNLPNDTPLVVIINVTLMFGIMCTYPLQVFPVIEILEAQLFQKGKIFGPPKSALSHPDETHPLLSSTKSTSSIKVGASHSGLFTSVALEVPASVAPWKRNLFRAVVTVCIGGFAILFRNVFAYFNALIGAVGSCPLAFIIPCLIHFILVRRTESYFILGKDIAIMIIGFVLSFTSLFVSIQQIVASI